MATMSGTLPRVEVRLYGALADFLPRGPRRRSGCAAPALRGPRSVKDLLESVGVPHPEIDVVLVDGEPVGFGHVVRGGERVAAYPAFRTLDIAGVLRAGPGEPPPDRFVLDVHLGALARRLRLCGFDADHAPQRDDAEIARIAEATGRVVLTRDVGLLKRSCVRHGHWVRATDPLLQAAEILRVFRLRRRLRPFTRCVACNGVLAPASRDEVAGRGPAGVAVRFDEFSACPGCGRVFWRGSHQARLAEHLAAALRVPRDAAAEDGTFARSPSGARR
jgi:hypothetical protein